MNLGLNKLHGGALLTKMVNSSTVPVSVKERAEALKQMGVKEELERTKGIFKSWLDTVAKIRGSAELLQMQESNKSLQNIGTNLKQGVVGLDSAAPLQSAIDMINSKLSHLAHLKQRIETLNNLGHNRNRLKRKRDKPNLALVDYNRYNSGYEVACREFIETEHELIGEYDFLIQEAKAGPGPCAKELAFLNHWCVKVFPLVCQNDIASVFQSLPNLSETSKAYEQRQSKFVQSAKLRGVQGTCGLTDTSTLTKAARPVSHQVGGSTKLEKKFAADFSTTTSAPAILNEATVSADGVKSSPPPPPPPPRRWRRWRWRRFQGMIQKATRKTMGNRRTKCLCLPCRLRTRWPAFLRRRKPSISKGKKQGFSLRKKSTNEKMGSQKSGQSILTASVAIPIGLKHQAARSRPNFHKHSCTMIKNEPSIYLLYRQIKCFRFK